MKQILILITIFITPLAMAAKPKKHVTVKRPSNLSTDIHFDNSDVQGRYQTPGEVVATVENEKPLLDLIEPRKEFKDRLRKSVTLR